jgi:hypothetical protein
MKRSSQALPFSWKGHNVAPGTVTREGSEVILKNDALNNRFKFWMSEPASWFLSIDRYQQYC